MINILQVLVNCSRNITRGQNRGIVEIRITEDHFRELKALRNTIRECAEATREHLAVLNSLQGKSATVGGNSYIADTIEGMEITATKLETI